MKTWDYFLRDVLPDVPGCPEPVAEHALLRAAQAFCERTKVWKLWLDPIQTVAGIMDYEIELEQRTELVQLVQATLDGRELDLRPYEILPADWRDNQAGLGPLVATPDRKNIVLLPAPTTEVFLRVEAILRPSNAAEGVEDFLFDLYVEPIALGAKARLMQQPGKPYSNPTEAAACESRFNSAMATLSVKKWRGFSSAMPRSRVKTF